MSGRDAEEHIGGKGPSGKRGATDSRGSGRGRPGVAGKETACRRLCSPRVRRPLRRQRRTIAQLAPTAEEIGKRSLPAATGPNRADGSLCSRNEKLKGLDPYSKGQGVLFFV